MDILRFLTSGNVDDGKSTLIGRMLLESGTLPTDEKARLFDNSPTPDVSRLLDGLKDEREQGITIDVAYRFFTTQSRRFIIADCPGHFQYTRNLVCGASNSDAALVLVDVTRGIQEQTRRHISLLSLLRVSNILFCLNKMDAINYEQQVFEKIKLELEELTRDLNFESVSFFPLSALKGDNIVAKSSNMSWHQGPSLLKHLETMPLNSHLYQDLRFIVQKTLLSSLDKSKGLRSYAGRVLSGNLKVGQSVRIYPGGYPTTIKSILLGQQSLLEAKNPMSVTVFLEDEFDLNRGSLLTSADSAPQLGPVIESEIYWMDQTPATKGKNYILRQTTQEFKATLSDLQSGSIGFNEFGKATFKLAGQFWFDSYRSNRETGRFLLIDPVTYSTAGVGFITNDSTTA